MSSSAPPPVSSLRVAKPGKSRFVPVITAERRQSTSIQTRDSHEQQTQPPSLVAPVEKDDRDIVHVTAAPQPQISPSKVTSGRAIESLRSRREAQQRQRRKSIDQRSFTDPTAALKSAAALPDQAAETATARPATRITMAHFLKDSGQGIPMSKPISDLSKSSSSKKTTSSAPNVPAMPSRTSGKTIGPQVRIVNDQIQIDEQSLSISQPTATSLSTNLPVIHESSILLNSSSYLKRMGNNRWRPWETELFYTALAMCGTDFSLMSELFERRRTREQCKSKYKIEESKDPERVMQALDARTEINVEEFKAMVCREIMSDKALRGKDGQPKRRWTRREKDVASNAPIRKHARPSDAEIEDDDMVETVSSKRKAKIPESSSEASEISDEDVIAHQASTARTSIRSRQSGRIRSRP